MAETIFESPMKLLFLANRIPFPPYRGDKLKIYNLAKELHPRNHLVLVTFYESHHELKYKRDLLKYFDEVHLVKLKKVGIVWNIALSMLNRKMPFQVAYFKSKEMARILSDVMEKCKPDGIHIQHLRMAMYIDSKYRERSFLDLPDAISLYFQRKRDIEKNPMYKLLLVEEHRRLLQFENKTLSNFDTVLCCSQEDAQYLQERHTGPHYKVLENGVDTKTFQPVKTNINFPEPRILFTGNMDYAPNVDAVCYFVRDIFPKIKEKHPTATFEIAGQKPVKKVLELNKTEGVEVTGFIPKIQDAYARSTVVVAPIRFGAGTQNKVLEALCMEVPVVCTPIGFFGLSVKNGQGIYCEKNTLDFINRLNQILDDVEPHHILATKTGQTIRERFAWEAIAKKLESYVLEAQNSLE